MRNQSPGSDRRLLNQLSPKMEIPNGSFRRLRTVGGLLGRLIRPTLVAGSTAGSYYSTRPSTPASLIGTRILNGSRIGTQSDAGACLKPITVPIRQRPVHIRTLATRKVGRRLPRRCIVSPMIAEGGGILSRGGGSCHGMTPGSAAPRVSGTHKSLVAQYWLWNNIH
ncbi:hypothetical protein EJ06DRAFT_268015 [Trichodelitschia bisporula]|uniref:Uncharacterized protein n=1 Tax=Trichodelitschia bisporula TaxID=703511 RepID=A0A6G1HIL7_9PEZI|nr:hypothetical protein EJ06DRAFT_268015 [Trichodelitschia bisporula]